MKVYVSEENDLFKDFELVNDMKDTDVVVIMPGGISSLKDLFYAIVEAKDIYLCNEKQYYNKIISLLFNMYQTGKEKRAPFEYMKIESDVQVIVDMLMEKQDSEKFSK